MQLNAKQNILAGIDLAAGLTKQQAEQIYALGKEAVIFALLQQARMLVGRNNLPAAIASDPSTPSSQKPVFVKPNKNDKNRGKKPGRKKGHKGFRRQQSERIDRVVEHKASRCPDCGSKLNRCSRTRDRYIEDLPDKVRIETVRHIIHRDFCPNCRKAVEPVITEALPKSSIGNGILILSAWLHFALGNTISQILEVFNFYLQFKMSQGGLVQMWHRLAGILRAC
ncbi:MAG: hypothetical protein ABIG61_03135 [Planctomycetota bacterium]